MKRINDKIASLVNEKPNAYYELQNTLSIRKYEEGSNPWLALKAGLARSHWIEGNLSEALERYQKLETYKDRFPEATAAIQYIQALQNASDQADEMPL